MTSIDDVRDKHCDRLMLLPNVVGVGIGERKGKPVIKVFVSRKVPESELQAEEVIPRTLDAYETDVEEMGSVVAEN